MLPYFLVALYLAASAALLVFGLNCYVMLALWLRRRRALARRNAEVFAWARGQPEAALPRVTTQLPLFNEANVAERLLRAVAALDYPRNRHQIQVLDDSTDETRGLVDQVAATLRAAGHDITVRRRADRRGFKAGALAAGLADATGEFVAIFDADFVPPRDFLRRLLPFFQRDARLGVVQARWGHLNASASLLTRAQAIGIDGHFMIEQAARAGSGLLMNFNGTAGIWRLRAIADAGGWSADTLTEDLDLSYRAQLAGWGAHFVTEVVVPGELPADIVAFKSQQFRWAKGSLQTAGKLLPRIFASRLSPWAKLQAALHLTHYAVHPLMLLVAVLAWPVARWFPLTLAPGVLVAVAGGLLVALAAPSTLYVASQRALHPRTWWRQLRYLPGMVGLGVGLAVANSRAALEALAGWPSAFVRTPKRGAGRPRRAYRAANPALPWIEGLCGLYCAGAAGLNLSLGRYLLTPFLLVYAAGFLGVAVAGWRWQAASRRCEAVWEPALAAGGER